MKIGATYLPFLSSPLKDSYFCSDGGGQSDDGKEVRRGSSEASADEESSSSSSSGFVGKECQAGDPEVPKVWRAPPFQGVLPASREGDPDQPPLGPSGAMRRRRRPPGGRRGLPRRSLRGRQPLRHPRQTGDHHAQRLATGQATPGRE